jgi:hypothetical protein
VKFIALKNADAGFIEYRAVFFLVATHIGRLVLLNQASGQIKLHVFWALKTLAVA